MIRIVGAALASLALLSPIAAAKPIKAKFESTERPTIGTISVTVDPELVGESSRIRRSSRDDLLIDPKEAEDLSADLHDELVDHLSAKGLYAPQVSQPVGSFNVTITKIVPSNPGFTRNGFRAGVSAAGSIGRGGAAMEAEWLGPEGETIATFSYSYFEPFLDQFVAGGAYTETRRTFDRFARRVVNAVEDNPAGTTTLDAAG